jgi:hypothetical protein
LNEEKPPKVGRGKKDRGRERGGGEGEKDRGHTLRIEASIV